MVEAYSFVSNETSTEALCARLNTESGWQWRVVGDNWWYGDYIACRPFEGVRIRIIDYPVAVEGGYQYKADVKIRDTCATPTKVIDEAFRAALAQIGAHTIEEIYPFD
jgi:hypothetical protein